MTFTPRTAQERRDRIKWATLAAADGCEASARELEDLLAYDPRKEEYLSMLDKGNRAFARFERGRV